MRKVISYTSAAVLWGSLLLFVTPGAAQSGAVGLTVDLKDLEVSDEGRANSGAVAASKCSKKGTGWRLARVDELRAILLSCNDPSNTACRATEGSASSDQCAGCGRLKGPYQGAGTKGCYLDLDMYPGGCLQFWSGSEVDRSQPNAWWTVDYTTAAVVPGGSGNLGVKCVKSKSGAPPPGKPPEEMSLDWDNPPGDPSQGEVCIGYYEDVDACCKRKGKRLPTLNELRTLIDGCTPPPNHHCSPGGNPTRADGCYLRRGFDSFKRYKCGQNETVHTFWAADPTPRQQPPAAPFVNVSNGFVSVAEHPYTEVRVGRCVR